MAGYRCDNATDNKYRYTVPLTTYGELADLRTGKAIFFSMSLVEQSVDTKSVREDVEDNIHS